MKILISDQDCCAISPHSGHPQLLSENLLTFAVTLRIDGLIFATRRSTQKEGRQVYNYLMKAQDLDVVMPGFWYHSLTVPVVENFHHALNQRQTQDGQTPSPLLGVSSWDDILYQQTFNWGYQALLKPLFYGVSRLLRYSQAATDYNSELGEDDPGIFAPAPSYDAHDIANSGRHGRILKKHCYNARTIIDAIADVLLARLPFKSQDEVFDEAQPLDTPAAYPPSIQKNLQLQQIIEYLKNTYPEEELFELHFVDDEEENLAFANSFYQERYADDPRVQLHCYQHNVERNIDSPVTPFDEVASDEQRAITLFSLDRPLEPQQKEAYLIKPEDCPGELICLWDEAVDRKQSPTRTLLEKFLVSRKPTGFFDTQSTTASYIERLLTNTTSETCDDTLLMNTIAFHSAMQGNPFFGEDDLRAIWSLVHYQLGLDTQLLEIVRKVHNLLERYAETDHPQVLAYLNQCMGLNLPFHPAIDPEHPEESMVLERVSLLQTSDDEESEDHLVYR